jgi:transcriptional regulator with XRE-family HTH domain
MVHMARPTRTDGAAIRLRRELNGWNRIAFAAHVGMNANYLAKIESGANQASPAMLKRIADALGCPVLELVKVQIPTPA